jgi:membrane associated rhomboid family serine protease
MAFFQDPARQPAVRLPAATLGLVVVLVAAHVARIMATPAVQRAIIVNYAFFPARYSKAFLAAHGLDPGSLWDRSIPFVSYIFLHANFTHLLLNCVWLLPFGAITARRFGVLEFYAFFLICGVAGAAAHLATHWGSPDYAIGASAAIAGLMAAGFRLLPFADATRKNGEPQSGVTYPTLPPILPILSPRVLLWSALVIAIFTFAGVTGLGSGPGVQVVAWQAHIGGYLAGLVLAGPFDQLRLKLRPTRAR